MINTTEGLEKIHPWIFKNTNQIIVQIPTFWNSPSPMIIGGLLTLFVCLHASILLINKEISFTHLQTEHMPYLISLCIGLGFFIKGRSTWNERKEHGGVMQDDTFIIFDKLAQNITKQKNTQSEIVGTLKDTAINLKRVQGNKGAHYRLLLNTTKEVTNIARIQNKRKAEALLEEIKKHLEI